MSLPVERITVRRSDLKPEVLPRLRGTVFHVTSEPAWREIAATGAVRSNKDARFPFTFPQSQNNFGRQQNWVCLFDLRDVEESRLDEVISLKLNFLKPTQSNPVFLFLDSSHFERLVPWTDAPTGAMLIPYVETWYPGDIPLAALGVSI